MYSYYHFLYRSKTIRSYNRSQNAAYQIIKSKTNKMFYLIAEELPYVKVPLHTVLKLTPTAYGCHVEYVDLEVPAVCTHRERPDVSFILLSDLKGRVYKFDANK